MTRPVTMLSLSGLGLAFAFATLSVQRADSQTTAVRPRNANPNIVAPPAQIVDKNKLDKKEIAIPTPLELLDRIIKLEVRAKASEAKANDLAKENEDLKTRLKQIEWDFYRPGGQQGLKVRAMQKSLFNRIPDDAWMFYFTR